MKKVVTILELFITSILFAQTMPITFHYTPEISTFEKCRLVGAMNGWNNADAAMEMSDDDGDGEYEITIDLPPDVQQMYKFVLDGNWGLAWNDPDNPDFNPQDNDNSLITPADPMVVYLLPRDVNTDGDAYIDTTRNGEPIRAIFAATPDNRIDPASITLEIDGVAVDNPQQYYDAEKQELRFTPFPSLENGEHTIRVTAASAAGSTQRTSTFNRQSGFKILKAPVDFYYDENNSRILFTQDVSAVSLVGSFNNWNHSFNPLQDEDGDGVWETTVDLEKGDYEYKFKLNYFSWISDPDTPVFAANGDNNIFTVVIDSLPSIKLVGPNEAQTFTQSPAAFRFQAFLRPGATSEGVDAASIICQLDGSPVNFEFADGLLTADVTLPNDGRHQLDVSFSTMEGLQAADYFTYGLYTRDAGAYQADAAGDEPYAYPAGAAAGSADILSVLIDETAAHDSLSFNIKMAAISERTRLGLLISNPGSVYETPAPLSLDVLTSDWSGQGVFAFIGAPGNALENLAIENRFMENLDPAQYSDFVIPVDADSIAKNIFQFNVSVKYLDSLTGSWSRDREFTLFSYLADENGSGDAFEVTAAENGSDDDIDPDIYDVAFIHNKFWQQRLLANYIPTDSTNGPRVVALDGQGRGLTRLAAADISDSLAFFGPQITFFTPDVTYWRPQLTIYGEVLGKGIAVAQFTFNGDKSTISIVDNKFAVPVTLVEGENIASLRAVDANNIETVSRELELQLYVDHEPQVSISAAVQGRTVTLTAAGTSPDDLNLSYAWSADENNPTEVVPGEGAEISFELPKEEGEYYFNVLVADAENRTAQAREMIFARDNSVRAANIDDHAAWIDDAVVYEIYPRAFTDQGGFDGVVQRIPDMRDLGINTIWFMPIFEGPTIHGYAITNYFGLEGDYGTEQDFRDMMSALKKAGIRVILDFVVNHTSVQHPFMKNVLEYRSYSPWKNFYIWDGEPGNSKYDFYFDWDTLPNLNYDTPDVHDYFIDVAKYWIEKYDIDGYRCDVAWGVQQRNADFWQQWRRALKNIKPEIFLEAEASSSDPVYYDERFDSANDWELRKRILGAISGTNSIDALHAEVMRSYPSHARPFRFVENHDEVRVAASHDVQRSILAHAMILTMNGVPLIYSGGEVGELTNRDKINWDNPDSPRETFRQLIGIHNKYIHNPVLERLSNDQANAVYSYAAVSGKDVVVVLANLKNAQADVSVDLSSLPFEDDGVHYLTDLLNGDVLETSQAAANLAASLDGFGVQIFYFGKKPATVVKENDARKIISQFALHQNYPNPFNPSTTIRFDLPRAEKATLAIFDVLGREVKTLLVDELLSGSQSIIFDASSLPSGVYMYRLQAGSFIETKKLLLLK